MLAVSEEKAVFIKTRNLETGFGETQILFGIDLDVYRGETLMLLGGSGGGKTVLIKQFIGLLQPWSGSVEVEGVEISRLKERELTPIRRKVSMMFQNGALFDSLTVGQNVAFPLRESGMNDEERIERRVNEALDIVKLPGHFDKMPSDLSGGMRKRVALARAVVERPACILFDEPHAGLDPVTADSIDHLIKSLELDHGITNVVVTHEMRSVFRIATRVVYMEKGKIYWTGTPKELKETDDPKLRNFIEGRSHEGAWD